LCIEATEKRVPIIAGTGSNSTAEAISLTRAAEALGADAALVVMPYYNKPSQEGLYQHFKAIHDSSGLPIIIYNIPGRSVVDMNVETMARLAKLPRIAGVKDATADLTRPTRMRHAIGPDFCQLSGEDPSICAFLAQGGHGCISVTANVAPALCSALQAAWRAGNIAEMARCRDALTPLNSALFHEVNPVPVKYAVSRLGFGSPSLRLPLIEASAETRALVDEAMRFAGLLN
jgi:4-hydroxy-tetrahydrodipicolinate synthase